MLSRKCADACRLFGIVLVDITERIGERSGEAYVLKTNAMTIVNNEGRLTSRGILVELSDKKEY